MANPDPSFEEKVKASGAFCREMFKQFRPILGRALTASANLSDGGISAYRLSQASWIFGSLCIQGMSLEKLTKDGLEEGGITLDHRSIAVIARSMLETSLMTFYLSEKMTEEEWWLRRLVLDLHDTITRYKMFKHFRDATQNPILKRGLAGEASDFRAGIDKERDRLRNNEEFKKLTDDRQKKILDGNEIYVSGLRAVVKLAGWNIDEFDGAYAYLSSYLHNAPVSFYRAEDHGSTFDKTSGAQYSLVGFALERAGYALDSTTDRIKSSFPDQFKDGWEAELEARVAELDRSKSGSMN